MDQEDADCSQDEQYPEAHDEPLRGVFTFLFSSETGPLEGQQQVCSPTQAETKTESS